MRNIHNCLLFYPTLLEPFDCSYPNAKSCGKRTHIIKVNGKKVGINLCKWRIKEIGFDNCVKEAVELKKWSH